ncbi:MAG: hypothetical protein RQ751_13590, partial [Longimicrobiales bacterium]|nr:hypothetical protein [Longimicrobiales bacterium]
MADATHPRDVVASLAGGSRIQHGPYSDRVYLMRAELADLPRLPADLVSLALREGYGKIIARCPEAESGTFLERDFEPEARVPAFFGPHPGEACLFLARFLDPSRAQEAGPERVRDVLAAARQGDGARAAAPAPVPDGPADGYRIREARPEDLVQLARCYGTVFRH